MRYDLNVPLMLFWLMRYDFISYSCCTMFIWCCFVSGVLILCFSGVVLSCVVWFYARSICVVLSTCVMILCSIGVVLSTHAMILCSIDVVLINALWFYVPLVLSYLMRYDFMFHWCCVVHTYYDFMFHWCCFD